MNPLDAEEHYGVVAMRPGRPNERITIDGMSSDWSSTSTIYSSTASSTLSPPLRLRSLSVAEDEAYVYVRLDVGQIDWSRAHYHIGIDTYDRRLGDSRFPTTGSISPVGLEFVVDLGGPNASRVWVDHPYNPYKAVAIPGSNPQASQYVYNPPFRTVANDKGQWDSLVVVPNRRRISRSGSIYPAQSYDRNRLLFAREDQNSLADWFADPATGVIEIRLPWAMLQLVDPSARLVLFGNPRTGKVAGAETDGFRFVVESFDPSRPTQVADRLPRGSTSSAFGSVATWSWPKWEQPNWYAETKPVFAAMKRAFAAIPESPRLR
jgi:hypothetical protein